MLLRAVKMSCFPFHGHLQYCYNYNISRILRHQNCNRDLKTWEKTFFMGMHFVFVFFFNLTLRFVFEKYWLVLMLTRAINTTGHPVLSRSHHVRLPPNNLLAPKIILKCDWQIGLPLCGRPILLITLKITDRIGLHSVLLPLLIIWEKPMKFFSVM